MLDKPNFDRLSLQIYILIEVQIGSYLEEDDIVRYDDDFGRIKKKKGE